MSYSIDLNDSVACSQHVGLSYAGHELHVILPSLFMDGLDVVIKAISFKEEGSSEGEILGLSIFGAGQIRARQSDYSTTNAENSLLS
jgi:hypothetical protein